MQAVDIEKKQGHSKGKAIMKRCGFQSWGQHEKSATNTDKQKRKRKLAKKAKRK